MLFLTAHGLRLLSRTLLQLCLLPVHLHHIVLAEAFEYLDTGPSGNDLLTQRPLLQLILELGAFQLESAWVVTLLLELHLSFVQGKRDTNLMLCG